MLKNLNYRSDLLDDLRNDIGYAAKYLSAALADSNEAFLVALRDVAEAQKSIAKVATEAKLNRESLYRMLSDRGNPRLDTLIPVLGTLGLRFIVQAETASKPATEPITYPPTQISYDTGQTLNLTSSGWRSTHLTLASEGTQTGVFGLPRSTVPFSFLSNAGTSGEIAQFT